MKEHCEKERESDINTSKNKHYKNLMNFMHEEKLNLRKFISFIINIYKIYIFIV